MKKYFVLCAIGLFLLHTPAQATTAVLCGDPALVDEDNDRASVWLILENSDSRSADETQAIFFGKEARVASVSVQNSQISIRTTKPSRAVVVSEADIDSSVCDGETLFSVQINSAKTRKSIGSCRCFED